MSYQLVDSQEITKSLAWLNKYWERRPPEYYKARTLDEAISLIDEYQNNSKVISGGVDVIGLMKNKLVSPQALIEIKSIPGLRHITEENHRISIGATTLLSDLERSPLIKIQYPALYDAACSIASPNIRNMATISGNLCQEVRCCILDGRQLQGLLSIAEGKMSTECVMLPREKTSIMESFPKVNVTRCALQIWLQYYWLWMLALKPPVPIVKGCTI